MRLSIWNVSLRRRLFKSERGQSFALAALVLLFVFLAVMLTFAIGHRTREKIKMQSLADSGAYSLAVMEARTFNFFAWTNRARVAHDVAILSIHSHASYITYLQDLMYATGSALDMASGILASKFTQCPPSQFTICCMAPLDAEKTSDAAEYYKGNDWPAYGWMKSQKDTWDPQLGKAALDHYKLIQDPLQKEQLDMLDLLKEQIQDQVLAGKLAKTVDDKIEAPAGPDAVNLEYLDNAIFFPTPGEGKGDDDWNEIESATRYPDFITNRAFLADSNNWISAMGIANGKMSGVCSFVAMPDDAGNAKTTASEPGSFPALQNAIHSDQSDTRAGWAGKEGNGAYGYGAEDHGKVTVSVFCNDNCTATGEGEAFGGVYGGTADANKHFWGKDGTETENDAGKHKFEPSESDKTVYLKHPRYKWGTYGDNIEKLWNHPHTLAVLTKPMGSPRQVFDFELNLVLPVPMSFKTRGGAGDSEAAGKMAAIGGGLVYYHKPKVRPGTSSDGSDNWQEPPSFWNPFWRAKLHPIRPADATEALTPSHAPSADGVPYLSF